VHTPFRGLQHSTNDRTHRQLTTFARHILAGDSSDIVPFSLLHRVVLPMATNVSEQHAASFFMA